MAQAPFITLFSDLPKEADLEENYFVYEFDHPDGKKKSLIADIVLLNGKPFVRAYIRRGFMSPHGACTLLTVPNAFSPPSDTVKPYPWSELN